MIDASERGVEIKIIIPDETRSDSKLAALAALGCLPRLIQHGIQIYSYQPTLIHTKSIVVDDQTAIVGSVNFNQRSQRKDDEICLVLEAGDAVQKLIDQFQVDLGGCKLVKLERLRTHYQLLSTLAAMIQPFRRNL